MRRSGGRDPDADVVPEARADAERASGRAGVEVRDLVERTELGALLELFDEVWSLSVTARPLSKDLLLALAHAGNPVLAAFDGGVIVGGSLGVLGVDTSAVVHVHSHMTGVRPALQHRRIGRALKLHQRAWALARGIATVTWTFDPLVARNGWFNLQVLGATASEYLVDFYGPLDDAINEGAETDRLLVTWDLVSDRTRTAAHDGIAPPPPLGPHTGDTLLTVEVPDDIVAIRRRDPAAALEWRRRVRSQMRLPMQSGQHVLAMESRRRYVLGQPVA